MQSDRWRELTRTFRFRLAVNHMVLVFVALAATFMIVLLVSKSIERAAGRNNFNNVLEQVGSVYLGAKIPVETVQLPEELLEIVETQFPGIHIGLVEQENQPGGWTYEVIGSTGREWMEILLDPSGRFWVADRKSMEDLFAEMEAFLGEYELREFSLSIHSPAGELLAGSPLERNRPNIGGRPEWPGEQRVLRKGSEWFGWVVLYDGNLLDVSGRFEESFRATRDWVAFFALIMAIYIPLSGWIGFHISRKAMAGVKRVAAAARAVKDGNFTERVAAGSEGTEIEELEEAFNDMVVRIELLMRELRDVTVNVAHDLKTPVARIRGMLESINWAEVAPAERERISLAAMEECDRIAPLIDSVLELAQAETGALSLQSNTFDLAAEVKAAHSIFSSLAEDHRIAFTCTVPDSSATMTGDRGRMQRVIANLIDNALKFAPEGGSVSVLLECTDRQAVLSVEDNGPGIPEAARERVFERFYRLDASRSVQGNGLGLSLVKAFVHAHGGTVKIESGAGGGCSVAVVLPRAPV